MIEPEHEAGIMTLTRSSWDAVSAARPAFTLFFCLDTLAVTAQLQLALRLIQWIILDSTSRLYFSLALFILLVTQFSHFRIV